MGAVVWATDRAGRTYTACIDCGRNDVRPQGRGLCQACALWRRRHGAPRSAPPRVLAGSLAERLDERTHVVDTGCWEWTGAKISTGYGEIKVGGSPKLVHRLSYELHVAPIPDGMQIDHLCGNRLCLNPEHLEVVTRRENILRSSAPTAQNAVKTHCPRGHLYDVANTYFRRDRHGRQCRACARLAA